MFSTELKKWGFKSVKIAEKMLKRRQKRRQKRWLKKMLYLFISLVTVVILSRLKLVAQNERVRKWFVTNTCDNRKFTMFWASVLLWCRKGFRALISQKRRQSNYPI